MNKYWLYLDNGYYGYLFQDNKPLPGDYVTIRVKHPDGSVTKEIGWVLRVE
ncbi:hypothetical protein BN80_008 [Yersinia phage phiR1-RT]|uniref:Uncharacterized protein n=2 Tax=Tegunavirus TaxID=1921704 RepID=A0A0B4ZWY7_9CAUD|nr:hypothetical protein BN80_008 [Yersinia phage phiR1-RT]YP_009200268.1 hypothetical protein AVV33_gp007 [Yersinia phage vB_YenM_TG1]AJD81817.1 hypothetical protein YenMTG1_007 [Yersinia phage vB_YenM_TG1]CCI88582.1 hypothetical protein BN80_008 [Yersinia phage phiR1-RT]